MNNFVDYFYNMHIEKVLFDKYYYSFIYNGYLYRIYPVDDNNDINTMISINRQLVGYTLVSEIILNKENKYVSLYYGHKYILIKVFVNINKKISLNEISCLANALYMEKLKIDWGILWSKKIDYLEDLINENGKKYPIIVDSFNYFVGMAENAISYYNSIKVDSNYKYVISHKKIRLYDTVEQIYNPINITFDYRARDIAEYIKCAFFWGNKNIFNELNYYIQSHGLSVTDTKLIVARLLYPSFYLDMYEDILIYNESEKIILPIVNKLAAYEKYLAEVINYFMNYYDIPSIPWLNNNYQKKNED